MNRHHTFTSRCIVTALLGLATLPAARAADVAVSIGFSQPGVYGRVDIGRYPQPVLVAQQPVVIGRPVYREPVYLWVPPGHRRDWRHQCQRYGACGAPVYFVDDGWYQRNVVVRAEPGWRDEPGRHGHGHGHERDHGPGPGRGHGHHHHDD
ncbi:hypothetical protein [Pelomonas cellulosilytica]|uniref:Uncharacterized protein n=1 Tax=Pelomonas cellulosilytica TaxID=2906762 RepID=A0ABS8Y2K4_9BURK|nr:hypothetical protein [Pelomonas sp. P8]MCE4557263.1 hypothetical protein [Pelomonas sp. P8]